jgi:hypothetical protein
MAFELYSHRRIIRHHIPNNVKFFERFFADPGPSHLKDKVVQPDQVPGRKFLRCGAFRELNVPDYLLFNVCLSRVEHILGLVIAWCFDNDSVAYLVVHRKRVCSIGEHTHLIAVWKALIGYPCLHRFFGVGANDQPFGVNQAIRDLAKTWRNNGKK